MDFKPGNDRNVDDQKNDDGDDSLEPCEHRLVELRIIVKFTNEWLTIYIELRRRKDAVCK